MGATTGEFEAMLPKGLGLALAAAAVTLSATACPAATLVPVHGRLSVNHGQGFEQVSGPIEAKAGDSVMVSPDGSANVLYGDGCKITLQPGSVMTIAELSPCASGSYAQDPDQDHFGITGAIFGGVVLGVTGFVAYEISQSSKTSSSGQPVSP
jgi:hypothetical protein